MSQKRGLAVFFGCTIAAVIAYVATYPRFHPPPAAVTAVASTPALPAAALALTHEFPVLPASPLSWARLTPEQRVALAPFANQWDAFSDARKRKWLKIASRFSKLSPEAQKRLQERMTEWIRMTPEQRRVARENYQVSKDLSAQARERAWKAYQQLPEAQKERLAAAERKRRPTVVSAPPTGHADRDVNRLVNAHDHPVSATIAPPPAGVPASAASAPAAASASVGAVVPATPIDVSPTEAPSIFNGS